MKIWLVLLTYQKTNNALSLTKWLILKITIGKFQF